MGYHAWLPRLALGADARIQLRALWFLWLVVHGHTVGSPILNGTKPLEQAERSAFATPSSDCAHGDCSSSVRVEKATTLPAARQLQDLGYVGGPPFFDTAPYVNLVVYDSRDVNCNRNYMSPPISDPALAGYPADGTNNLINKNLACGIAPARFVFTTSDIPDYHDESTTAKMQLRIQCALSFFIETDSCENVLDATSYSMAGFPRIEGCRFMAHEARFILATRLEPGTEYSLTVKLVNPPGRQSASDNSFHLTTEFYQVRLIEGTRSPIDMVATVDTAKDEDLIKDDGNRMGDDYTARGYITGFTWQPEAEYSPLPGKTSKFKFGLRTFGHMDENYAIDIVSYPTNVWKFGHPGDECLEFSQFLLVGVQCEYRSFAGAASTESNGFRIRVGATAMNNQKSGTTFDLKLTNPLTPLNMYWTATSFRVDSNDLHYEAYTVWLDKPISVLGSPSGKIVSWELASIDIEQWVTIEFKPGNTIIPFNAGTRAGIVVILPPASFDIISSSAPQDPGPDYNALPCVTWPTADREANPPRWVCTLEDTALFKETMYRVRLRVRNPMDGGAATSWRVEIWQEGMTKPISISRSILGFPVSGGMLSALAPSNQELGVVNRLRFDFTPSQDIGLVPLCRLEIVAPEGFMIIKRCLGFTRIELPDCSCEGSDGNSFRLTFTEGDVIKAGVTYVFSLDVINPALNVPNAENFWLFETVRPDGVPRDSARYPGFFLFPGQIASFGVIPVSRHAGPQDVVVRFISNIRIPFDDYISIRAPEGVLWYTQDLRFDTRASATNATLLETGPPEVSADSPNIMVVQLTNSAEAEFEYGIRARITVPGATVAPNRWWIEQKRQTGLAIPNNWRYIASTGGEGFKTQVLVNTKVEPFNIVEEAWQNPTLIVFEATETVMPRLVQTASGPVLMPVVLLVRAPTGFTYICPLTETVYLPDYSIGVPEDTVCQVDHNTEAERNKLYLQFPNGIEAAQRIAFTIDIVNSAFDDLDPSNNVFEIATMVNNQVIENKILPGYSLAKRMDNTRFVGGLTQHGENRFPEFVGNKLTFVIGTTFSVDGNTILEVKAPTGFRYKESCLPMIDVKDAGNYIPDMLPLPTINMCMSLESVSKTLANVEHIHFSGQWQLGNSAISISVINPMFTPLRNFWGFTIMDMSQVPLMSESWVYGFYIQEVLNPVMISYNSGNGNDRESAINRIEMSFTLTTEIPGAPQGQNSVVVKAPVGFLFPPVCRYFSPDTGKAGTAALPAETTCQGDGEQTLTLMLPQMRPLLNQTRYEFRFRVVNPKETFVKTNVPEKYWQIETRDATGQGIDRNRIVPSFPIYQRVSYFKIDTLSKVGLASTMFRMHFRTDSPLPPQQIITIKPPQGTVFGGVLGGDCIDEDPVLLSRRFDAAGLRPLISGVTRLPEWTTCSIISPTELRLKNEEPLLGGRPLMAGPVFEFFVKNATNAERTPPPGLNLFEIIAQTTTPLGQERWAADGWTIFPELKMTKVEVSNPGYGLYTNFTFTLQTITELPSSGKVRIVAPDDYFFGPLALNTTLALYDPLVAEPPAQGVVDLRPSPDEDLVCHVLRPPLATCPFEFTPCVLKERYEEMQSLGINLNVGEAADFNVQKLACASMVAKCEYGGKYSDLISCVSRGRQLQVELGPDVVLRSNRLFKFLVQGYNARQEPVSEADNEWLFMTIDNDSEETVLDRKVGVPGLNLMGIVYVDSVSPSDTKVGSIENYVLLTIRLTRQCDPPATLRIEHPIQYMRNANAAFQGSGIQTGSTFPRMTEKRQTMNVIEILAVEEMLPAGVPLEIRLGLSNPVISPTQKDNIWSFRAFSRASGFDELLNVNLNVTGFKVFGEFSLSYAVATVLAPVSPSILAVWIKLKSELRPEDGVNNLVRIWYPKAFQPRPGLGDFCQDFQLFHDPNREGVAGFTAVSTETATVTYLPIPSGTECFHFYDQQSGLYFTELLLGGAGSIGGLLDYGLDYAFEFGIQNPAIIDMPPPEENVWRVETLKDEVILHLADKMPGFELEQIKEASVKASDTTKRKPFTQMTFYMMSDKYILGGSKVYIEAPEGFVFTCAYFRTDPGLSNTTTCLIPNINRPNRVEFTLDSQDPKAPNSPFTIYVYVTNPEFTPQANYWSFEIKSPLGRPIDIREFIPGFDITDDVFVSINPTFPYLGQTNKLEVVFQQNTIMNQADTGNELVLTGPSGYVFPENCTQMFLRLTNMLDAGPMTSSGYAETFTFPPPGMECMGFGNSTLVVRLPNGAGLLKNNYTLEIDVENPPFQLNGTTVNEWQFMTRVRNTDGQRLVDANRRVEGFEMRELVSGRVLEGAAAGLLPTYSISLTLVSLWLALCAGRKQI